LFRGSTAKNGSKFSFEFLDLLGDDNRALKLIDSGVWRGHQGSDMIYRAIVNLPR
jgi:hypothetical protein